MNKEAEKRCIKRKDSNKNMKPLAEEYDNFNELQIADARDALNSFKINSEAPISGFEVIDIGCGSGNVTKNTIMNFLNSYNWNKMIGIDSEENMINHSKKYYSHEKLEYHIFDMDSDNVPKEWKNQFQVLFAFHSFHWMNQEVAVKKINRLLSKGGETLIKFCLKCPYLDVLTEMKQEKRWKNYISNVPISHNSNLKNTEEYIKFFENNGFVARRVEMKHYTHTFESELHSRKFLEHICVFKSYLNNDLFKEFMDLAITRTILLSKSKKEFCFGNPMKQFCTTNVVFDLKKIQDI